MNTSNEWETQLRLKIWFTEVSFFNLNLYPILCFQATGYNSSLRFSLNFTFGCFKKHCIYRGHRAYFKGSEREEDSLSSCRDFQPQLVQIHFQISVCRLSLFRLHKEILPANLTVVMHSRNSGLYFWLHYKLIFVLSFQSIGKSILSKGLLLATLEHIHEGLAVIMVLRHTPAAEFLSCFVQAAPCIFPGDFP